MGLRDYVRVYLAVCREGHPWWRAVRCCNDCRKGEWQYRDMGEMRAQLALMSQALKDKADKT